MKNKAAAPKGDRQFLVTFRSVIQIFQEIQSSTALAKSHVMELVKLHSENHHHFDRAWEQVFLKIFKSFHQKANKKIPSKFQSVAELFFKEITRDAQKNGLDSFNYFCGLLSQAIYSTIMNVRVMSARILFVILKIIPSSESLLHYLTDQIQDCISKSVHFLTKQKVSTYRQLGIKLCSLALMMKSDSKKSLQYELFKILSTEDNELIRKMVVTNIPISQNNIDSILLRLRDKNSEIRATILRRLLSDKCRLEKLKLNNRYKLLYDGFGTKDVICKQQALRYFASYFKKNQMQQQNKFATFIQLFQPQMLLVNSHLYALFTRLIGELLASLPTQQTSEYIRKLCLKIKNTKDKQSNFSNQLIWLKNASVFKPELKDINSIFDEFCPSGTELSVILQAFVKNQNMFAINQFLQLFANIKMPDEIGRNKMFDTLKDTLTQLSQYEVSLNFEQIENEDDICNIQTRDQIRLRKFMLSYYDMAIISESTDLILPIITTMRTLRPQSYVLQLQQTISQWSDSDNPIFKQKQTTQLTLNRLKSQSSKVNDQKTKSLLSTLNQKLTKINRNIQFLNFKTLISIEALSRIQYNWNVDPYMPIIKDQLSKQDQTHGLYLLGLFCLDKIQKVQMFLPLYWQHIMQVLNRKQLGQTVYKRNKLHLMISLKVMTDFIVKFNILNSNAVMNNTNTQQLTEYNSDTFMTKITMLMLDKDPDIKVFSIQCLCRIIYHNRVDENNISTYFLYLLLLWWETGTGDVSARSVHTISLFFRSYIEKGNQQIKKLAEMLCIFHKILKIFEEKKKTINKKLIVYNLKISEFIKKTVGIATTVLKYHKERKVMWTYEQPELGPQQFFLLYLLYEPGFQNCLDKSVNICDFYIKCPLQTLIFVKKKIERFQQLVDEGEFYPQNYKFDKNVTKKSLQQLIKIQKQIESHISVKNQLTFNESIINTLDKIFIESSKYINQEARRIAKNIEEQQIFINIDSDNESDAEEIQNSQHISQSHSQSISHSVSQSHSQNILSNASQQFEEQKKQLSSQSLPNKPKSMIKKKALKNLGNNKNRRRKQSLEQIDSQRQQKSDNQVSAQKEKLPIIKTRGKRIPQQKRGIQSVILDEEEKSKRQSQNSNPVRRSTRNKNIAY